MMETLYMDNYNNNLNRGGDYNYYNNNNNYPDSHRGGLSSWPSEDVHHPDGNFHRPAPSRRRPFPHGPPTDFSEDGFGFVKLYVAGIPRTCTQEEIRSIFEVHGNIVEIAILKEQGTGQQKECCFIKYTTLEEADRAIGALNNIYSFPGATLPIKVRYAQGERERLGNMAKPVPRLYVNYLNKQASKRDIGEIFSAYGHVEDIHILCDEFKQSRGCGFVEYARSDMAIAAIDALNGTFNMGCDQPLLVRFAHPRKPRVGDSRSNSNFGDTVVGPHTQEPVVSRPVPYLNDSVAEKVSGGSHQVSPKATASLSQSPQVGGKLDAAISSIPTALEEPEDPLECDWSEHVCPDGYSYFYNCETCESRWEKPQEYALFEQQLQKQHELKKQQEQQSSGSCKESHSPSTEEVPQMQQMKS